MVGNAGAEPRVLFDELEAGGTTTLEMLRSGAIPGSHHLTALGAEHPRINELIDAKVKKEANRYIQRWADDKISVENGRWGPFIRFGKKMLKIPKKADDTKYTAEEAATFSLDDVKKMIELEIPGAFAKKERKPAAKKKAATKKAAKKKK